MVALPRGPRGLLVALLALWALAHVVTRAPAAAPVLAAPDTTSEAHAVVLQPDGPIVVAGAASFAGNDNLVVARYHPDGSLDLGFGAAGLVTTLADQTGWANAVALQPDGRILTAGTIGPKIGSDFALLRYTPAGGLDTTFGQGGLVATSFSNLPR